MIIHVFVKRGGMGKNTNTKFYVKHPRYGANPKKSKYKFSKEEIEKAHWRYSSLKYFSETAIPANTARQQLSTYQREIYVDIEEQCEVCKRPFLFFAQEQRHWFEVLGFFIDAHCTRCIECRKEEHEVRRLHKSYQKLLEQEKRTVQDTKKLKKIATELYNLGYIKDKNKVDKIGKS